MQRDKMRQQPAIRVLHLGRFLDSANGGLENSVIRLLDSLKSAANVANLVAHRTFSLKYEELQFHGWNVYRVPSFGKFGSLAISPWLPIELLRLNRKWRFDIVHLHLPDPLSCLAALILPRRVKLVVSWHSDIVRQKFARILVQPIVNRVLRRASAIVAATPAHFTDSTQLGAAPTERRYVVPYGIDFHRFQLNRVEQRALLSERRRKGRKFMALAVGRLVYYKGFDCLLRALALAPDIQLTLAGDGPQLAELQLLARRLGVANRVDFAGRVSDDRLRMLYHLCDVYCLSSIEKAEAFGLVQTEAMACAKPVLCFDLGNGVNWVNLHGKTGLSAPVGNIEAFAANLRRIHADPVLAARLGAAGRKRVRREFSVDAMRIQMLDIYREILRT
ncbi:MAG: glycosyltransferase [Leptospirales bacterium]|nr:glycosyltransferase [Leptospirales bacterium]